MPVLLLHDPHHIAVSQHGVNQIRGGSLLPYRTRLGHRHHDTGIPERLEQDTVDVGSELVR